MTCSAGNTARRSFWWPTTVDRQRRKGNIFGYNNVYPYSSSYSFVGALAIRQGGASGCPLDTVGKDRRQGNIFGYNNVYPYSSSYSFVGGLMRIDLGG
eukprot:scaffold1617_cov116-Skeletonema_menzelii.AAC.3